MLTSVGIFFAQCYRDETIKYRYQAIKKFIMEMMVI